MSTPTTNTQTGTGTTHQEFSNKKEEIQMNRTNTIRKLNMRLSNSVSRNFPAKVIGGLALGALLAVATALPLSPAQASPLTVPPVEKLATDIESTFGLAEEYFHPITGEPVDQMAVTNASVIEALEPNSSSLGEEWFHPITGELTAPMPGVDASVIEGLEPNSSSLGEEWFHPVTGKLTAPMPGVDASIVKGLVLSGFGPAEENFHPITGE